KCSATGLIPEYTAAEAKKHIGERSTIVGKVSCIDHGRRHTDVLIGGCDLRKALLWIVVPLDASGPELDPETVRGVQIAVTGKIELAGGTPQITIKSTTQIVPRTALRTNYIGRAYDKQQQGDIDGAIAEYDKAIALCDRQIAGTATTDSASPLGSDPYFSRGHAKELKGDIDGAVADYTQVIANNPAPPSRLGGDRRRADRNLSVAGA